MPNENNRPDALLIEGQFCTIAFISSNHKLPWNGFSIQRLPDLCRTWLGRSIENIVAPTKRSSSWETKVLMLPPREPVKTTAPIPITIPNVVSKERNLFRLRASRAIGKLATNFIGSAYVSSSGIQMNVHIASQRLLQVTNGFEQVGFDTTYPYLQHLSDSRQR